MANSSVRSIHFGDRARLAPLRPTFLAKDLLHFAYHLVDFASNKPSSGDPLDETSELLLGFDLFIIESGASSLELVDRSTQRREIDIQRR